MAADTLFQHYTVYKLNHIGRVFFTTFLNGHETSLTEVEASRLLASGARLIDVLYPFTTTQTEG
jgi:hypothetical protein